MNDDILSENNRYYKYNTVADLPSLTNNCKIGYLLLQAAKDNNNNNYNNNNNNNHDHHQDSNFNNNKGYIEKILNKDKEKLDERYGSNIYTSIDNIGLRTLKHEKNYNTNDDSDIDQNNNNIDDNLIMLNEKHRRRKRDGKNYFYRYLLLTK